MQIEVFKPELPALGRIIGLTLPGIPLEVCRDLAEAELMNYFELAQLNPNLQKCTKESIVSAIKSTLIKGLSLDPNLKLVYVTHRNVNVGTKEQAKWVTRLEVTDTVNALLWMAQKQGKLLGWSQPEVQYAGNKVIHVSWRYQTPQGEEMNEMTDQDFSRLATYSARQNRGTANALYTSYNGGIDPGFASTKCIRHATVMKGLNPLAAIRRAADPSQYPQVEGAKAEVQEAVYHEEPASQEEQAAQTQTVKTTDFPTEEPNNLW